MAAGGGYTAGDAFNWNSRYASGRTTITTTGTEVYSTGDTFTVPLGLTSTAYYPSNFFNITYEPPTVAEIKPKKKPLIKECRIGKNQETDNMSDRKRLVQVFVVDPDKRIADEKSVLHQSEIIMTSKTNEELLFDVSVKTLLENHNKFRKSVIDEDASENRGRDVHLKAINVRDLEMKVVVHAEF